MRRRAFLPALAAAALRAGTPLKFAHREASMRKIGNLDVFALAARIPGLLGVELQIRSGEHNLTHRDMLRRYKKEAHRWGIQIPSLSGPFARGNSIRKPEGEADLRRAIRSAEFLGSSTVLVPFFRENCPDMSRESEYGPVVDMLLSVAPDAAESGVVLGLENSLNPAGNNKLCDLAGHPNVRIYYDLDNCEFYGHKDQAVSGVAVMGRERICQVHVKNEDRLIEEPGRVDWRAALAALKAISYDGWYVFESRHVSDDQCAAATTRNIAFLRKQLA